MSEGSDVDLAAIARLRQLNLLAARSQNHAVLSSLLTEDAVLMAPGMEFQRGRPEGALGADGVAVIDYDEEFEELVVCGRHAFEWGVIRCVCMMGDGKKEELRYKVMRVLQRQADGEWKVHRAIWNDAG